MPFLRLLHCVRQLVGQIHPYARGRPTLNVLTGTGNVSPQAKIAARGSGFPGGQRPSSGRKQVPIRLEAARLFDGAGIG